MTELLCNKDYYVELNNGFKIPAIGYGTANERGDICATAVKSAIESGYRLIDTASQYKNEEPVGIAAKRANVQREELFISSKLWNDSHGYDNTMKAFEESLKWLDMDYLDIFLIHWPNPAALRNIGYEKHNAETWLAMEELYLKGRIKAIGVSNFQIHHMEALRKHAKILPMINQICLYPGKRQDEIVSYCNTNGIKIQAYCPLGVGKSLKSDLINALALKYEKTPAQICLRWHYQNGFIPLPKSVNLERIKSNLEIMDFILSESDMWDLNKLNIDFNILPDPDVADF